MKFINSEDVHFLLFENAGQLYHTMTDWTSIGIPRPKKEMIEEEMKKDGFTGTIGEYLVEKICGDGSINQQQNSDTNLEERLDRIEEITKEAAHASQSNTQLIENLMQ